MGFFLRVAQLLFLLALASVVYGAHSDHDHAAHTDHDHAAHVDHGHEDHADHGHEDKTGHEDHTDHGGETHTHGDHTDHGHGEHSEHGGGHPGHHMHITEEDCDAEEDSDTESSHHGHEDHTKSDHGHMNGAKTDHGHEDDTTSDHVHVDGAKTDHGHVDGAKTDHGHMNHHDHMHSEMAEPGKCLNTKFHFNDEISYLDVMSPSPVLNDFTLCTFAMTDSRGVIPGVIASLSHDQPWQNFVILGAKERKNNVIRVVFQGQTRKINMNQLGADTEIHLCIVTSSVKNQITVFLNSKSIRTLKFKSIKAIPEGGKISVGKMTGKKYSMYTGTLRNFIMWGTQLSEAQIMKLYETNDCPGEEIVTLAKTNVTPMKANIKSEACIDEEYTIDNTGDKVQYLEMTDTIPDLEFISICVRVTTNELGAIPGTIASYSTKANPKMITVGGEMGESGPMTRFEINGEVKSYEGQFAPNTKYNFCMIYHLIHGHLMTYVNGELSLMVVFKYSSPLPGNGVIIVGQRQKKMGGCFDRDLAFTGKVQGFTVWGRALSMDEINAFSKGMCPNDAIIKSAPENVIPHGIVLSSSACPSAEYTLDNTGDKLEYLQSLKTFEKAYDFMTVCSKIVTDENGMLPGAVASYSTKNMIDALYIGGEMKDGKPHMRVTLNGDMIVKEAVFRPSTEYSNCVSYHIPHGHVLTYINGILASDLHFPNAKSIPAKGMIIAGQKQGSFGGSFDRSKAYNGKITDFLAWGRVLSAEEMMAMATMNMCPDGAIISMSPDKAVKVTATMI